MKLTTTTTTVTTYKYHYIGSQITTIEIDQTQTVQDGEEEPVTTTTKDDEIRIHLGANSRPISFEYYTENQGTQQTTSATYYYHYDLHGNVIRVTNSSGTTVIQYTYDQLGTIVSETNANSIYNPFTYMGEAQVIHDDEFDTSGSSPLTGLYSSGSGYYNPKTGTFLGGSGIAADINPVSNSPEAFMARISRPLMQAAEMTQEAQESTVTPIIDVSSKNKQNINLESQIPGEEDNSDDDCGPSFGSDDSDTPPQILLPVTYKVAGGDSGNFAAFAISDSKDGDGKKKDGPEGMGGQEGDTTVITGENGKVAARVDKNGNLHVYDKNGKEITDKQKKQDRWSEICKSVDKGKGKARFFDSKGEPCSGSIGMKMGDGKWTGIFVAYNSESTDKNGKYTTNVRIGGKASDFGFRPAETTEYSDEDFGTHEHHKESFQDGKGNDLKESDFGSGDYITTTQSNGINGTAKAGIADKNGKTTIYTFTLTVTYYDPKNHKQLGSQLKVTNMYVHPLFRIDEDGSYRYDLSKLKKRPK